MSHNVLRQAEVLAKVGFSATTLWRLRTRDEFPPHVRLSAGLIGWIEEDVDRWIEERRGGPQRTGGSG